MYLRWLTIAFLGCLALTSHAKTAQQIYQEVSPSIFTVYSVNSATQQVKSFGSGVAVRPNILATNCHVLMAGNQALVSLNGERKQAQLVYKDLRHDLCLLHIPEVDFKTVTIRSANKVQIGERVYAIGNPIGLSKSLSQGLISNKHRWRGMDVLQTDASISKGSSGGGLFDEEGRLIGITTLMARKANDISLAIPSDLVEKGLTQLKSTDSLESIELPTQSAQRDKERVVGTFNNQRVAVVKYRQSCFIFVFNKSMTRNPTRAIIWWPRHPNYLFLFPKPRGFKSGYFVIGGQKYHALNYKGHQRSPVAFAETKRSAAGLLRNHAKAAFIYNTAASKNRFNFDLNGFIKSQELYRKQCR